jgi:leucyl aminopeptidase
MKITIKDHSLSIKQIGFIVLPVYQQDEASSKSKRKRDVSFEKRFSKINIELLKKADSLISGELRKSVEIFNYTPTSGKSLKIRTFSREKSPKPFTLYLSGLSKEALSESGLDEWRKLGGDAYKKAAEDKEELVTIYLQSVPKEIEEDVAQAILEGLYLSQYRYDKYKNSKSESKPHTIKELSLISSRLRKSSIQDLNQNALTLSRSVCFARDLVNCPPRDLKPIDIVKASKAISNKKSSRLTCKVLNKTALKRIGAEALLAVSQGSRAEPFMIHLVYKPPKKRKNSKPIILIGKGVSFDSGGLSIKPSTGMETMKCDMAGAATVLGVMMAISTFRGKSVVGHEVHALIPTVENMISGDSTRPGDVVRAINGKTIEVLNTDAEGRLILADALSYSKRLNGDITIDLATLTGACVVALGEEIAGLFTSSDELSNTLINIGARMGELFWPLPLAKEYRSLIDSKIADLKNIGPGGPGATIGALFLKEFVPENTTWAHLDIAGPAFCTKGNEYRTPGGTGFGVRTLVAYLQGL